MVAPFFKEKIPRDAKYRAFIREQPCCVRICNFQTSECHHATTGGKSIKGSDYESIPLCTEHHGEYHHGGRYTFYTKYNMDKWQEIATYNGKYLVELKKGVRKI